MYKISTKFLKQDAVYWEPKTRTNIYGEKTFEPPVEVPVRWSDEKEEFIDENGERQISKAKVMVDREMMLGGFLMLGDKHDIEDESDPVASGGFRIRGFKRIPTIDARETVRIALL